MVGCDHGTSYDQSGADSLTPAPQANIFNLRPHTEGFALQNERHRRENFRVSFITEGILPSQEAKKIAHNWFPKPAHGKILPFKLSQNLRMGIFFMEIIWCRSIWLVLELECLVYD